MSYSEELDIIKLFGKKVLFIDVETIGLPIQKINKEYKPEERFYHYSENEKYENSRMIQISYKYYENYNEKICDITEIIDYIIRPDGFEVNGTEFHTITNEIANENGIKINKALREIIYFLLHDEIDFIAGYNIYFDINILMNELYRINKIKTLGKIQKLIDDKKIIDIAQICAKMNLVEIKNKKKYQISKQSIIYKKLFDKEQQNSHNSKYDVLNLIEITNNLYCNIKKKQEEEEENTWYEWLYDNGHTTYDDDDSDNPEYCGYGPPTKKIEYITCSKCKNLYIIKHLSGRNADGDFNSSIGVCEYCNKTIKFKILGYNLFNGETDRQLEFITLNNYDILFLSESSINIIKSLQEKYIGYSVKSHCGYTYLGINKKITMNIIKKIEMNGIIFLHVKINNKYEIIFGSVHLAPFKENIKVRNEQLKIIMNELPKNIPVIFGGDTNMRDEESVAEFELDDVYLLKKENKYYSTYPNRNFTSDKLKFIPKNNFRYDRFFTKNCKCLNFITIDNNESDHLAIESIIEI